MKKRLSEKSAPARLHIDWFRPWCESSAVCTFSRTLIEPKVAVT